METKTSDRLNMQSIIDSPADIIILSIDCRYNYLVFNAYHHAIMLQAYGLSVREGMNLLDCITNDDDRIKAKNNYDKAFNGISHSTIEEYGTEDRNFYETRYFPLYNELKQITGATAIAYNVTDRVRMEKALKKSEELFRKAFITSPDSININRLADGMYISINDGFKSITGYSWEEVIGKTSLELNIWNDPESRNDLIRKLKERGKVENHEAVFKMKNGKLTYGIMSATIIDLDNVPHILSITRDITEKKNLEASLRENEIFFREVFESVDVGLIYTDLKGKVLAFNKALETMGGITKKDILGKNLITIARKLISAENLGVVIPSLSALIKGKNIPPFQIEHRGRILEVSASNDRLSKRIAGIVRDITDIVNADMEVRKIGQHYQALIEKAPDGIVLLDALGEFKFISRTARKIFGYSETDSININPSYLTHPDDLNRVTDELAKIMAHPEYVPTIQYRFSDSKGNWRWVESTFSNLLSEPSVESIVINFHDISDRKLAEENLLKKIEELEWLNKLMVGREIKMIGLKKEINELLATIGKSEKYNIYEGNQLED